MDGCEKKISSQKFWSKIESGGGRDNSFSQYALEMSCSTKSQISRVPFFRRLFCLVRLILGIPLLIYCAKSVLQPKCKGPSRALFCVWAFTNGELTVFDKPTKKSHLYAYLVWMIFGHLSATMILDFSIKGGQTVTYFFIWQKNSKVVI